MDKTILQRGFDEHKTLVELQNESRNYQTRLGLRTWRPMTFKHNTITRGVGLIDLFVIIMSAQCLGTDPRLNTCLALWAAMVGGRRQVDKNSQTPDSLPDISPLFIVLYLGTTQRAAQSLTLKTFTVSISACGLAFCSAPDQVSRWAYIPPLRVPCYSGCDNWRGSVNSCSASVIESLNHGSGKCGLLSSSLSSPEVKIENYYNVEIDNLLPSKRFN
ncbi:hypothetical protein J6590_024715 [Homalodisca vitripennis]|nr:hypothetical protein J6590_024715 [Homalodisca vitripennis]